MKFIYNWVAAAIIGAVMVSGCDMSGLDQVADDFQLIIGLEDINTPVIVKVVDAGTSRLVSEDVEVSFDGSDADLLIDEYSDPISSTTIEGGLGIIGVANIVVPSEASPVAFRIRASAPGYNEAIARVAITAEGQQQVVVRMVKPTQLPAGAARVQVQEGDADQNGTVSTAVSVTTPPESEGQGTASISIPAGTQVQTATGEPVSGRLTTSITYYNPKSDAARRAFPGGFDAEVVDGDGSPLDAQLTTVGFSDIQISDQSGNKVKAFSQGVDVGISIAEGALHPATGQPIRSGDRLNIFSFDAEEGVWRAQGEAEVVSGLGKAAGLRAVFGTTHLSGYSVGAAVTTCEAPISLNFNGNVPTSVRLYNDGFDVSRAVPSAAAAEGTYSSSLTVPAGISLDYLVRTADGQELTGSIANSCSGVSASLPASQQLISATLTGSETPCSAGQKLAVGVTSSYSFIYAEDEGENTDWDGAQSGTASASTSGNTIEAVTSTLQVKTGASYRIQGSVAGHLVEGVFDVPSSATDGSTINISIDTDYDTSEICE